MAPVSRSQFIHKSVVLNPACKNDPVVNSLKNINNSMRKIDAYVILGLKGKRKLLNDQRKKDLDNQRKADKLNLLNQKKANPINFIKDKLPRTGLLDSIRNFILYTFLGAAVPLFLKSLPSMLNFAKLLVPFGKGLGEFASNVLGGFVNAVDFGYKVHDKMRGILKTVTGAKYEKELDGLEKNLNIFLNGAIILGLTIASSGVLPKIGKGRRIGGVELSPNLSKSAYKNIRQSYKSLREGEANIGDRLRLFRHGVTDARQLGSKSLKPAGKFFGKFGRIFGKIPVIGGLIDFTLSLLMGEPVGRAAAKAVGSSIGFGLGALIPGLGQIGVGELIGSIVGDIVGGALYDTLSAFGKPKKHASGGSVGGKSVSRTPRTIKSIKTRRPGKQPRQKTSPGKNIGGEEAIKKLFPETKDAKTANPLGMLVKNSAIMKKAGVFGNLLGSGMEMMALGQRIEKSTLTGFENYLGYAIQSAIDDQSSTNAKVIGNSMFAMATGGIVPASRTIAQAGSSPGYVVAREIVKSFTAMLDSKSSEIFQNIRRELELKSPGKETAPVEPGAEVDGMSGYGSTEEIALLKAIRFAEGTTDSYGTVFGGKIVQELADGKMTVGEVIDMGNTGRLPARFGGRTVGYGKQSGATGAYQFMPKTLGELINLGVLKASEAFTPELQDKAALALAARRGVKSEDLKREGLSSSVAAKLAPEWASFPTISGGSFYSNQSVRRLSDIQQIYKQSMNETPLNLRGKAVNIGKEYQTNTGRNQYYKAPRKGGREHAGVDIDLNSNSEQITFLGGIVDYIGYDGRGYYKFVDILTPTGMIERLAELGKIDSKIKVGARVSPGQVISRGEGPTGVTHLEYRKPRTTGIVGSVNPLEFLRRARVITGGNNFKYLGTSSDKPNTSSITKPLKIASSPQFSKLQAITNVATGIYSGEDVTNTHFIRQTIIT